MVWRNFYATVKYSFVVEEQKFRVTWQIFREINFQFDKVVKRCFHEIFAKNGNSKTS